MLKIIYTILEIGAIVLLIAYLLLFTISPRNKEYNLVKNIKHRLVFSSILCVLFIVRTILSFFILLPKLAIVDNIVLTLLWSLYTIYLLFYKKIAELNTDESNQKSNSSNE